MLFNQKQVRKANRQREQENLAKRKKLEASAPDLLAANKVLTQQRDDLLAVCKRFMEIADNGSAAFDDPEPGSIYLKAESAIAKADKAKEESIQNGT